jgi:hypothetical protein
LRAEHSGYPQAEGAERDGKHVRRKPVISKHPIVQIHPATGEKALFVNPGFTKKIDGLKDEESDAILKLLFNVCFLLRDLYNGIELIGVDSIFRKARICKLGLSGMIRLWRCGITELRLILPSRIMMSRIRRRG